jgi:hypothetical protein
MPRRQERPRPRSDLGWGRFRKGFPWYNAGEEYPLAAYSEFMPPLRTGINPYDGSVYPWVFRDEDLFGWQVLEIEEEYQLRPGLENIGRQVMHHIFQLGTGTLPVHLAGHRQRNLVNNLFWPARLASHLGQLKQERYVIIQPYSLSKTKDDQGRVCWTFFGGSEQGPEKAFWKSFYESPEKELPESVFLSFMRWIFEHAYGIPLKRPAQLRSLGFRILPAGDGYPFSYWKMKTLPSWTREYLIGDRGAMDAVHYLLTFRPFDQLPSPVQEKYLDGKLHLLPFPGSMVLWGIPEYIKLQEVLSNAIQIPMLRLVKRDEGFSGLRVPQSGWAHQPKVPGEKAKILEEFIVDNYIRTSRFDRFRRNEDRLLKSSEIDPVIQTLFSTHLEVLDLYNKPMARNSQILSETIELLLDGPRADRKKIGEAALHVMEGGLFRYRFYFPPMRAGLHEVFWHRPLVACISQKTGNPEIAPPDLITGYLAGYPADKPDLSNAVELWPRFRRREHFLSALHNFDPVHDHYRHQTPLNLMALLDTWELMGQNPLDRNFARGLVRIPKEETLEGWLASFSGRSFDPAQAKNVIHYVEYLLEPKEKAPDPQDNLTFRHTATRDYEEAYWNQIYFLAHGEFINKDNADVVQDRATLRMTGHRHRDLQKLGDYLLSTHQESILAAGMEGKAEIGELPFRWETDFEYNYYGGWKANQEGTEYERNILAIIPGKNRGEAVVLADHYDTAYMGDVFDPALGGSGARLSANGADDNYSATAALLLAAPIFLEMSREGRLERDIWLLHLTGEEFPADCLGARNFCRNLVQRTLEMRGRDHGLKDLSSAKIKGILVMDMIAHNRDHARDIFQIAPGKTGDSLRLAYEARKACQVWNANVPLWNESPDRKGCKPGQRIQDVHGMPPKALHLKLEGEIRTWEDPESTLYNTDGMIFSDTGIPVILFMENYDIDRSGYHDRHDTMENIDLDYGAAVSAIAIETMARLAAS